MFLFASCSTSSKVNSGKLFQNRKYQKGWYVNSAKSYSNKKKSQNKQADFKEKKCTDLAEVKRKSEYTVERKEQVNRKLVTTHSILFQKGKV